MEFFHFETLSWKDLIDVVVNITFLYFKRSYALVPAWSIIFKFGIFLVDLTILLLESLSEIKMQFSNLFFTKNSLNIFVFFISSLKSATTNSEFTLFFCSRIDYAKRGPIEYDKFKGYWIDSLQYEKIKNRYRPKNKKNKLDYHYNKIRLIRENKIVGFGILGETYKKINNIDSDDWLIRYEILELVKDYKFKWVEEIKNDLILLSKNKSDLGRVIKRGLDLLKIKCN